MTMNQDYKIYHADEGKIPAEDKLRLEAYLRGRERTMDDSDDAPRWLAVEELPYHGGGVMARRREAMAQTETLVLNIAVNYDGMEAQSTDTERRIRVLGALQRELEEAKAQASTMRGWRIEKD